MLRFGPDSGPVVVVAMPLFEEANRTRAFVVSTLRALAARGVASALPDLPGQGESVVPLASFSLQQLTHGFAAAVEHVRSGARRTYGLSLRSGALVDRSPGLVACWRLSPQDGPDLHRELTRIETAGRAQGGGERVGDYVEIAGNLISAVLLDELAADARPDAIPVRTVRLTGDPRSADLHLDGTPLWRRSEPGNDPALADRLAADIAAWITRCEG